MTTLQTLPEPLSVTPKDPGYPPNLLTINDHPRKLWIRGTVLPKDSRSVAVIGSRNCSQQAINQAAQLVRALVALDVTIISGLAKGIDAVAHRTALKAGGRTLAVVGTGLNHLYPAENRDLHNEIAWQGAVLSQFEPNFRGLRGGRNFLMRNVTMSGLALGTVVIEAAERSGTRSQINSAIAHGRPVFLLKSLVDAAPWAAQLTQLPGVHVVERAGDILEGLGL